MYKIIGADGKEYGPVSADQLRQWLNEGRVNKQTRVLSEGSADWKPLGEVPELAQVLPTAAAPSFAPIASDHSAARQMVLGPAIFILVLAILSILYSIVSCVGFALQGYMPRLSNVSEETAALEKKFTVLFSLPLNILGGVLFVVCLIGAISMLKLKSYGLAMAAAIIMLLPCNCCCFLNIGAGIWALIVLSKPEVKSAFQ